jgi:hypothetical protein
MIRRETILHMAIRLPQQHDIADLFGAIGLLADAPDGSASGEKKATALKEGMT